MNGHSQNVPTESEGAQPTKVSAEWTLTLDKAWRDVDQQFFEQTGQHLMNGPNEKAGVLQAWQRKYEQDAESSRKRDKLGSVIQTMLDGIEVVGAFAAQAASTIFAPAGMCFNAFAFLIDVPRQLKKVYDGLHELFGEVSDFLVKFKILKRIDDRGGLNEDLIINTNRILMSFVKICILSIRLLNGNKVLTVAKVFFLKSDSGVSGELEAFRRLVQNHSTLTGTVTLEHVIDSQRDVQSILTSSNDMSVKLSTLAAAHSFEETKLQEQQTIAEIERKLFIRSELRQKQHHPIRLDTDDIIPATLSVVKSASVYREWMSDDPSRSKLFVLAGCSGSGKSCAMRALCKDLLATNKELAPGQTKHVVISYDFASAGKEQEKAAKNDTILAHVLKSLSFQIACQDPGYAKSLQQRLRQYSDTHLMTELALLWPRLQITSFHTDHAPKLFLLLDGVTSWTEDLAKELLNRMIPSQRQGRLQNLPMQACIAGIFTWPGQSIPTMNLEDINTALIQRYVNSELRKLEIFEGADRRSRQQRSYVVNNLPKCSSHSFTIAAQKLMILHQAVMDDSEEDALADLISRDVISSDDAEAIHTLTSLADGLTPGHIEQINCLLMWIVYDLRGWALWIDELDECCYLAQNKRTLEPLVKKLQTRFSKIFMPFGVTWAVRPDILTYLKKSEDQVFDQKEKPTARFSLTFSIENAPEKDVRRFVWELNNQMEAGKFDFSTQSETLTKPRIFINRTAAHYSISMTCLKLLNNAPQEATKGMFGYARDFLPKHLVELRSVADNLSSEQKLELVQALVEYLSDPYSLEQELKSYWHGGDLLLDSDCMNAMTFWLNEALVHPGALPRHKRWISNLAGSSNKLAFLHNVALVPIRKWMGLIHPGSQVKNFPAHVTAMRFDWIKTYIKASKVLDESEDNTQVAQVSQEERIMKATERMVDWMMTQVNNRDEVRRKMLLGGALYFEKRYAAAIPYFKMCLGSDHHWQALGGLSKAYAALKDRVAQIAALKDVVSERAEQFKLGKLQEDEEEEYVSESIKLAENYEQNKTYNEGMDLYQMILRRNPQHLVARWSTVRILCAAGRYTELVELLEQWTEQPELFGGKLPAVSCLELAESHHVESSLKDVVQVIRDERIRHKIFDLLTSATALAEEKGSFKHSEIFFCQGVAGSMSSQPDMRRLGHDMLLAFLQLPLPPDDSYATGHRLLRHASQILAMDKFDSIRNNYRRMETDGGDKVAECTADLQSYIDFVIKRTPELKQRDDMDSPDNYIASLHSALGRPDLAKERLRESLLAALDVLEDDDPDNDHVAFVNLLRIFCALGDRRSAQVAFSLISRSASSWILRCGFCDMHRITSLEGSVRICQFCARFAVCQSCYETIGLGGDRWPSWQCSPSHKFMEFRNIERGEKEDSSVKVKIDFELSEDANGHPVCVGGRDVELKEWIGKVRAEWGSTVHASVVDIH